jgi:hypothetical protein
MSITCEHSESKLDANDSQRGGWPDTSMEKKVTFFHFWKSSMDMDMEWYGYVVCLKIGYPVLVVKSTISFPFMVKSTISHVSQIATLNGSRLAIVRVFLLTS